MKISQSTKWKFHMKIYSIWNFYILHLKIQILRSMKFMNSVRQLISAELRKSINGSLTSKFSFCHLKKWIKKGILCLGTTPKVLLIKDTKHKCRSIPVHFWKLSMLDIYSHCISGKDLADYHNLFWLVLNQSEIPKIFLTNYS